MFVIVGRLVLPPRFPRHAIRHDDVCQESVPNDDELLIAHRTREGREVRAYALDARVRRLQRRVPQHRHGEVVRDRLSLAKKREAAE